MRGQSANADCHRAPARHLWFANVILGVPFATPRARWTVSGVQMFFAHSNRSGWRMILRRGVRQPNLVANAPRQQTLRSPSSGQPSCQPAAGATQAVTLSADPLAGCHFAPAKAMLV